MTGPTGRPPSRLNLQNIPIRREPTTRRLFEIRTGRFEPDLSDLERRLQLHLLEELEARDRDRRAADIIAGIRRDMRTSPVISYVAVFVVVVALATYAVLR